jgi:hypothetical protein
MNNVKSTLENKGLNLEELEVCSDGTRGSLEITFQLDSGKVTSCFDGHRQALVKACWECVTHPKVLLFNFI